MWVHIRVHWKSRRYYVIIVNRFAPLNEADVFTCGLPLSSSVADHQKLPQCSQCESIDDQNSIASTCDVFKQTGSSICFLLLIILYWFRPLNWDLQPVINKESELWESLNSCTYTVWEELSLGALYIYKTLLV